jgi:hypothetical protein
MSFPWERITNTIWAFFDTQFNLNIIAKEGTEVRNRSERVEEWNIWINASKWSPSGVNGKQNWAGSLLDSFYSTEFTSFCDATPCHWVPDASKVKSVCFFKCKTSRFRLRPRTVGSIVQSSSSLIDWQKWSTPWASEESDRGKEYIRIVNLNPLSWIRVHVLWMTCKKLMFVGPCIIVITEDV